MSPFQFVSEPDASAEDQEFIRNAIYSHNMEHTGDHNYSPLSILMRDEIGKVVGGILGDIWGGWLHLTFLWVTPELRNRGYGKQLLLAAEDEARQKGCQGVFLETHSFQAPEFYRRNGFLLVGQLNDYPPGHHYFILQKPL